VQIGDKTYTKSEIKTVLRNARKALDDTIPAQREYFGQVNQFVQQKQNVTKLAHEKFPFLTDRNSEEYKAAQAMYQQSPWLHNLAASEMFIGAYLKGMKALVAEEKAASESKAKPKDEKPKLTIPKGKPPGDQSLVTTVGTPARLSPESRDSKAVRAQFDQLLGKRGVTADDAAKYLEQLDSVRHR
jgi:predicted oxidoreductase (fatty acid repression mutant protein)